MKLETLKTYEQDWAVMPRDVKQASVGNLDSVSDKMQALKELEGVIFDQRRSISENLDSIRLLLPKEIQGEPRTVADDEFTRLKIAVSRLSRSSDPSAYWSNLIQLVKDWGKVFGLTEDFNAMITKRARVIATTCLFSAGRAIADQIFDWAIVDEAGRATAPELLVPLVRCRRAILVGDERQLPSYLDAEITEENLRAIGIDPENSSELERSLFQDLAQEAARVQPGVLSSARVATDRE